MIGGGGVVGVTLAVIFMLAIIFVFFGCSVFVVPFAFVVPFVFVVPFMFIVSSVLSMPVIRFRFAMMRFVLVMAGASLASLLMNGGSE